MRAACSARKPRASRLYRSYTARPSPFQSPQASNALANESSTRDLSTSEETPYPPIGGTDSTVGQSCPQIPGSFSFAASNSAAAGSPSSSSPLHTARTPFRPLDALMDSRTAMSALLASGPCPRPKAFAILTSRGERLKAAARSFDPVPSPHRPRVLAYASRAFGSVADA